MFQDGKEEDTRESKVEVICIALRQAREVHALEAAAQHQRWEPAMLSELQASYTGNTVPTTQRPETDAHSKKSTRRSRNNKSKVACLVVFVKTNTDRVVTRWTITQSQKKRHTFAQLTANSGKLMTRFAGSYVRKYKYNNVTFKNKGLRQERERETEKGSVWKCVQ